MPEMKPRANARPVARPGQRPAQRPVAVRPVQAQLIAESRQPARLVLALVLLLVAFGGIIARDHNFWFGSDDSQDAETTQPAVARQATAKPAQAPAIEARPVPATAPAPVAKKTTPTAKNLVAASTPKPTDSTVVATQRTTVAPMDVEVVAGDSHHTVHPGSNATKVEIITPGSRTTGITAKLNVPTNAAELERVTTVQPALGSGDGSYPLLAQQMKVQGSVVLQAFIGSDGVIQNLRVLSGPAILASAAQQAVREWRFKPYMLNGQPVETKATITVNFTIKVADNSAAKAS